MYVEKALFLINQSVSIFYSGLNSKDYR